jgi:RecB family exonuclease
MVARFTAEAVGAGILPERIVIAFPDLERVAHGVEAALLAEGLEPQLDRTQPLCATALGRSLEALLTLALGGGDRTTALGILLGPHSDAVGDGIAEMDCGWRQDRVSDPYRLLNGIAQVSGRLGKASRIAQELARRPVDTETANMWQRMVGLLLSARTGSASADGRSGSLGIAASLSTDAIAAAAFLRAIGEMASVEGAPFSAHDVKTALRTITSGGTAGESAGRVQVTELSRLRSRRFDTVILGGLTAAEMPSLDSDTLADELEMLFGGGVRAPREARMRLAFYEALSRARRQLVLVRRGSELSGAEVRSSVLWDDTVDVYRTQSDDPSNWPASAPPCEELNPSDIVLLAPVFTHGRREVRRRVSEGGKPFAPPLRGRIEDVVVLERLSAIEVFSATQIETYLNCPYRWFYESVVRPEEIDSEFDARAVGVLAHALLKAFYDAVPVALGCERVTPERLDDALQLLERVTPEIEANARAENLMQRLDVARAVRWAQAVVADDAALLPGFAPVTHEESFGADGQAQVSLGGVRFRGRIDRIDRSDDAVFVTDYKSSSVAGQAKFARENRIQSVVYALAAREIHGLPVAGSVYRSLRRRQLRGFWRSDLLRGSLAHGDPADEVDSARMQELLDEAEGLVEAAACGIREGRIPREPSGPKVCDTCPLKTQCERGGL